MSFLLYFISIAIRCLEPTIRHSAFPSTNVQGRRTLRIARNVGHGSRDICLIILFMTYSRLHMSNVLPIFQLSPDHCSVLFQPHEITVYLRIFGQLTISFMAKPTNRCSTTASENRNVVLQFSQDQNPNLFLNPGALQTWLRPGEARPLCVEHEPCVILCYSTSGDMIVQPIASFKSESPWH